MSTMSSTEIAAQYGLQLHENISIEEIVEQFGKDVWYAPHPTVEWTEPGLKFVRVRLLSDPGFPAWDISYCIGIVAGELVRVQLPFHQLPKGKLALRAFVYAAASRDRLFLNKTCFFEALSTFQ